MPEDRRKQIQQRLDEWCAAMGYKDGGVNLLSLSHAIHVSKDELTIYFDQSLKTTFRIWLSDIRFAAAKKMMIANPDYSNDIISSECGFTSRTHLYRIFKAREACTPDRLAGALFGRIPRFGCVSFVAGGRALFSVSEDPFSDIGRLFS